MVKINGNVQYLSSGTSMKHAGGKVVGLFENTWMRACGVGSLEEDGSRKINKMGNMDLLLDVDEDRRAFDLAVINTIRTAIPEFGAQSLKSFYEELMQTTGDDESMVRRGVSSSLGKIAPQDLLLSGALSKNSPFFTETTVGKAIRQKGIEGYGIIEVCEELDMITGKPIIVDYPEGSDPEFNNLNDAHLLNNQLSNGLNTHTNSTFSCNLYLRILSGISLVLGAAAFIIAFVVLNVATLGTAGGIALAVCGGIGFFGGSIGLVVSRCKNSDDNQLAPAEMSI